MVEEQLNEDPPPAEPQNKVSDSQPPEILQKEPSKEEEEAKSIAIMEEGLLINPTAVIGLNTERISNLSEQDLKDT